MTNLLDLPISGSGQVGRLRMNLRGGPQSAAPISSERLVLFSNAMRTVPALGTVRGLF